MVYRLYEIVGVYGDTIKEIIGEKFGDGIMRKDTTTAKLTELEKERNKGLSKVRYIVEQYFGISHLYDRGKRARFTSIAKNNIDIWFRQVAYNIRKGIKVLKKKRQEEVLQG